jgi:cation diffusion facilitator family transporter
VADESPPPEADPFSPGAQTTQDRAESPHQVPHQDPQQDPHQETPLPARHSDALISFPLHPPEDGEGPGGGDESLFTVIIAFGANLLIAIAKTVASIITGSASLVAEAAHSWADTGNEVFLVVANRRSKRPAEPTHPAGFGREAYVWALLAALGVFVVGAVISVMRGVQEIFNPEPATDFLIGYIVLAVSFVLEGTSFLQSLRQARPEAAAMDRDLLDHVLTTSDPTLRAVFAEDGAALVGLVLAGAGLGLHQITGDSFWDALGSILVGLTLGVVAVILINRNRRFLIGQEADPRVRHAAIRSLLALPEVSRVTYLRLEIIGPRMISLVGDVDLSGDDVESHLAVRLRALEAKISASPVIVGAVLSLSAPDEPSLTE